MARFRKLALAGTSAMALSLTLAAQPALAVSPRQAHRPSLAAHRVMPAPSQVSREQARRVLVQAARNHGLNPNFVLAVSFWESGWNQAAVSNAGAIGLLQVMPGTGAWAGPTLLHRRVDLHRPVDNAEVGAALLRYYLDQLHDPRLALAAYYQGLAAVRQHGIFPSSRTYVEGIWRLRNLFQAMHLGG